MSGRLALEGRCRFVVAFRLQQEMRGACADFSLLFLVNAPAAIGFRIVHVGGEFRADDVNAGDDERRRALAVWNEQARRQTRFEIAQAKIQGMGLVSQVREGIVEVVQVTDPAGIR